MVNTEQDPTLDVTGIALPTGTLASFTEKSLHLEDKRWNLPVLGAVKGIIAVSYDYLLQEGHNPLRQYVDQQNEFESTHFNREVGKKPLHFKPFVDLRDDEITWSGIQSAQVRHDFDYHTDVVNPGPVHHLQHNVLHLAMINAKIIRAKETGTETELLKNYVTSLIFGVKCASAVNKTLPEQSGSPELWSDET